MPSAYLCGPDNEVVVFKLPKTHRSFRSRLFNLLPQGDVRFPINLGSLVASIVSQLNSQWSRFTHSKTNFTSIVGEKKI